MWAEFAPAKINLTLELTGKRADGYHTLQSLIVFAACGDSISAEPSDASLLSINGAFGHHLQGNAEDNLIMKALRAVEKICKKPLNVAVKLEKNLPVASGIGGGSADAAAMLRILRKILGKQVKDSDWQEVALALGADVPVCLESKSAFVSGIGEILHPVKQVPAYGIVLVNPMKALATKEVFGVLNGSFVAPEAAPPNMTQTAFRKYISGIRTLLYFLLIEDVNIAPSKYPSPFEEGEM